MVKTMSLRGNRYTLSGNPASEASNADHTVRKDAHGQNHIFMEKEIHSVGPASKASNANSPGQNSTFKWKQIHAVSSPSIKG